MTTRTTIDPGAMLNLATYHHEHEKYYAFQPLEKALTLQRASRILETLADRWMVIQPGEPRRGFPYFGAEDLNETSTIQYTGVLFLEGEGEPAEIGTLKRELRAMADDAHAAGGWLTAAMEASWEMAQQAAQNPLLVSVLGERHRIIANNWQSASLHSLCGKLLYRALEILDKVDLGPSSVRHDLAGPRFSPQYLYAAAELIDRAADLEAEAATLVHDNERRWRVFQQRVCEVSSIGKPRGDDSTTQKGAQPVSEPSGT